MTDQSPNANSDAYFSEDDEPITTGWGRDEPITTGYEYLEEESSVIPEAPTPPAVTPSAPAWPTPPAGERQLSFDEWTKVGPETPQPSQPNNFTAGDGFGVNPGYPGYGQYMPQPIMPITHPLAALALVLGVLSSGCCGFLSPVALGLALKGLSDVNNEPARYSTSSKSLLIASAIIGAFGTLFFLYFFISIFLP